MTDRCTCHPGSAENHWFEKVCDSCRQAQIQEWADMMHRFKRMDIRQYRRQHLGGKPILDAPLPDRTPE